jgi:hypothetical protein
MKLVLLVAVCGGILAASAAAAGPTVKHTARGNAAAKASLITLADLGSGWKAATNTGSIGLQLNCSGYAPSGKGIVETGSASSPDFTGGAGGPFILQVTSVYAKRGVRPGLVRCASQTLETITAKGIQVKILSQGALPVTPVGSLTAGYRVVADLYSAKTKKTLKTYFDVVLVGRGKMLSEITISTFGSAVPAKVEYALATIAYRQSGLPVA